MHTRHTWVSMVAWAVVAITGVPALAQWTDGQDAQYVLGQANFTSGAGATAQNGMRAPIGVALDATNGKLYVAEYNNHRILRFAYPITGNQPNAEAVLGQADFTSGSANRGGVAAADTLYRPGYLAVDSSGRLWVADSANSRVLRYDSAHTKADGAAADGVLGQADFTSWAAATTQNGMKNPHGMCLEGTTLYVADSYNHRVLRFDNAASKADGANADAVLGQSNFTSGSSATTQAGMNLPFGMCLDGTSLFVADAVNSRVLRFDNAASKANGANADAVLGQADFTSNSSATTQAGFNIPYCGTVDANGRLYVADSSNNRVMLFDNASSKANGANADHVLGQEDFVTNSVNTDQDGMRYPAGVLVDVPNARLFVSDYDNNRVLQFSATDTLPVEMSAFGIE